MLKNIKPQGMRGALSLEPCFLFINYMIKSRGRETTVIQNHPCLITRLLHVEKSVANLKKHIAKDVSL
jgi:hypothetical protein